MLNIINMLARGASFTGQTNTVTSNTTITIPTEASQLVINIYGSGGYGADANTTMAGGGGGGGGHSRKTVTLVGSDAGKTINYVSNASGSFVTTGTYGISTISAFIGSNGSPIGTGGVGGTASGGDYNQSGTTGATGTGEGGDGGGCDITDSAPGGAGGAGGTFPGGFGDSGFDPGGGGGGGGKGRIACCILGGVGNIPGGPQGKFVFT